MGSMKTLLVAALLLSPALTHAQTKTPVYIECDAESGDLIGKVLCTSLRDVVAKSPRYALLPLPGKEFHYVIDITSEPTDFRGLIPGATLYLLPLLRWSMALSTWEAERSTSSATR
jgi:hypothetical protein